MSSLGDAFCRNKTAVTFRMIPFYRAYGRVRLSEDDTGCMPIFPIRSCEFDYEQEIPHVKIPTRPNQKDYNNLNVFAISIDELVVYGYPKLPQDDLQRCIDFVARYQKPLMDFYNDDITFKQLRAIINER